MAFTRSQSCTGERILFTSGPLTTTKSVREAVLVDIGPDEAAAPNISGQAV